MHLFLKVQELFLRKPERALIKRTKTNIMKIRIILLLLLTTGLTQAQDNYMALSFGIGNPLGDYAKTESLADNGFAIKGFMADYSGAYYLIDYVGVGGSIKFHQNVLQKDAIRDQLVDLLPDGAGDSITQANLGYWSIVSFGAGPQFTLPINKLSIDAYFFPGLHIVTPPKLELTANVDGVPYYTSILSQNVRFGFEAGLAFRIDISETAGLRIFASYLQTSSKGDIIQTIEDQTGQTTEIDFSKTIQIFNAGIGLVYKL